jgi:glutathione S-transferase
MTVQILGYPGSNFTRTVLMAAHEKGIDFENLPMRPHSDEVKAVHPFGHIPVMRHDGLELAESQAIARYIDTAFDGPALIPADPGQAAIINQWVSMVASTIDQIIVRKYFVQYLFMKDDDGNVIRTEIDVALKRFRRVFATLEEGVAQGCLGGDTFTMADCFLMPMVAGMPRFPESKEYLEASPNLQAYLERHSQRPCFAETSGD